MTLDTPKITVIGTGRMGYYHTRLLSRLGHLDSIVEKDPQVAKTIGQQFGVPWYSSIKDLVKERTPNGVIVAVPTNIHSMVTREVVEHVSTLRALLIEKPVSSSVDEALNLKEFLDTTRIKVIVGHIEVFNPVIARIKEILNQEILGKIRSIIFQRRGTVAEARLESIGDVYVDIGVHDFDIASRLLPKGQMKLFSAAVQNDAIDNSSTIILAPETRDFHVTFLMSREYAGKVRTIDIEGTKASLSANLLTQVMELRSLEIARGEKTSSAIRIPFSNGEQVKLYGEPLLLEMWNLIDCIHDKAMPLVSISDGINALRIVEAARQSIMTGEAISVAIY